MKTLTGDILRNKFTGELYRVKKVKLKAVLLEAESRPKKPGLEMMKVWNYFTRRWKIRTLI